MADPVYVAGSGSYLPGDPVDFDDIDKVLGNLDRAPKKIRKWISSTHRVMREILDIDTVYYAIDPETHQFTEDNISMSVKAGKKALTMAGIEADEVDLICYGSAHQDQMPTASVRIQEALGIECCDELSIHANCTSAYKALYLAHQLIRSGQNRTALVLSSSMSSSELRAEYYHQEIVDKESLFLRWFLCDGAGAVLLSADPLISLGYELESTFIESVGGRRPSMMFNHRPAYWQNPLEEFAAGHHHLRQSFRNALGTSDFQEEGGSVFFNGFRRMAARCRIPVDRIRLFQINLPTKHISESVIDEMVSLGLNSDVFYSKLDRLGYCGPPMVLICLDKILREENLSPGDRICSFVTEVSKFMQAGYCINTVGKP
ncbi:MAG: 3-oxoacyl-ACP synthase [Thermodesulfobacteriota bacterium]